MMQLRALALAFAVLSVPAFADDDMADQAGKAPTDSQIISQIHHKNQGEIALAQLAEDRSKNDSVLGLARRIVDDHKKADQKAMDLASRNKLKLSAVPASEDELEDQSKLSSLMGAEFDREFLDVMEDGHEEVISWLNKTKKDVKNPELKDFISEIMPTLHKHHDLAESVQAKLSKTG